MDAGSRRSAGLLSMAISIGVLPLRVTCVFLTFAALRINCAGVICDRVVLFQKIFGGVHSFQLDLAQECAVLSGGSSHHAFD